jgi:hypothetical protein
VKAEKILRDIVVAFGGAIVALLVVLGLQLRDPDSTVIVAAAPSDEPGEFIAWALRDGRGQFELLSGTAPRGLRPCRLPQDGLILPVIDERTGLPGRVRNWQLDGPELYLVEVRQQFEADLGQGRSTVTMEGDGGCASGKVLATAETIMDFLYARSLRLISEGR